MKINNALNCTSKNSASTAHKAIQGRAHGGKPGMHRYERRRVRESLRNADWLAEENLKFALP